MNQKDANCLYRNQADAGPQRKVQLNLNYYNTLILFFKEPFFELIKGFVFIQGFTHGDNSGVQYLLRRQSPPLGGFQCNNV